MDPLSHMCSSGCSRALSTHVVWFSAMERLQSWAGEARNSRVLSHYETQLRVSEASISATVHCSTKYEIPAEPSHFSACGSWLGWRVIWRPCQYQLVFICFKHMMQSSINVKQWGKTTDSNSTPNWFIIKKTRLAWRQQQPVSEQ